MNNDFDTKQRLFGTDGIRGTVNKDKITAQMAVKLAMAAGNYFFGKAGTKKPRVLIGKDTRLSGYMLEPALVSGFTSVGLDAITTGPMPTPAIAHLTRALRCDLGVMISASHNPYEDNGLKLFGSDGFKLNDNVEDEIQLKMETNPTLAKSGDLGRARRMEDANGRYSEFVKQILPKHEDLSGLKVVLDCANGASYKVGPEVLFELGAEANIIGAEPNGKNINFQCGAMFPERMAKETKLQGADLGIAFDGDADRVIFSDENVYVPGVTLAQKNRNTDEIYLGYSSPKTHSRVYRYNLLNKSKELVKEQEIPSGHNKDDYIVERFEFKSHDGRLVPLTITRHKKTKIDGSANLLLYGY